MESTSALPLRGLTPSEILNLNLPPRRSLIGEWLTERSAWMLCGAAKSGKSHIALGLGAAVATGTQFAGWAAAEPAAVTYLDLEMSLYDIRDRLNGTVRSLYDDSREGRARGVLLEQNFRLVSREQFVDHGEPLPDMRTSEGRKQFLDLCAGSKLVIFDNINAVTGSGKETEPEFWSPWEQFIFLARDRGHSLLILHHSVKSRPTSPAGHSRNERVIDGAIVLEAVKGPGGLTANVSFPVLRRFPSDTGAFSIRMTVDSHGVPNWTRGQVIDTERIPSLAAEARRLKALGTPTGKIAEAIGKDPRQVRRWVKEGGGHEDIPR